MNKLVFRFNIYKQKQVKIKFKTVSDAIGEIGGTWVFWVGIFGFLYTIILRGEIIYDIESQMLRCREDRSFGN